MVPLRILGIICAISLPVISGTSWTKSPLAGSRLVCYDQSDLEAASQPRQYTRCVHSAHPVQDLGFRNRFTVQVERVNRVNLPQIIQSRELLRGRHTSTGSILSVKSIRCIAVVA